ncbi:MAG: cobyric acid synthase [Rhodobacteraceae bacterium]|nr:cobyric acid synthase [Paracoccaceae bacterium]
MSPLAVMIQGAGSNVGKSLLVASICRAYTNRGYKVAPFKPQNMSNNSSVTREGLEIGRAQSLQAIACKSKPSVHMNPVLLKPESNRRSQIIVQGKVHAICDSKDYFKLKPSLMPPVMESFGLLGKTCDMIIAEGAGSPAEVNLRKDDIANMGFARNSNTPVVLIGDIDRGGVIAQMVGTRQVLSKEDRDMIKGFVINKFRGTTELFEEGYRYIEEQTKWAGLGILPWLEAAGNLPSEDSLSLTSSRSDKQGILKVCYLSLDKIANFDDLDPLNNHPEIIVRPVKPGNPLPLDADLVIIPGSKSTRNDMAFIRKQGWDHDLIAYSRRGGRILGLCGGYQILGKLINDPSGIEGEPGSQPGLALLDVETSMADEKHVGVTNARWRNHAFTAYEIHKGKTSGPDCSRYFAQTKWEGNWINEGATSPDGRVQGTYLHGLFTNDSFRSKYLASIRQGLADYNYGELVEKTLDDIAHQVETHLDLDRMLGLMKS